MSNFEVEYDFSFADEIKLLLKGSTLPQPHKVWGMSDLCEQNFDKSTMLLTRGDFVFTRFRPKNLLVL